MHSLSTRFVSVLCICALLCPALVSAAPASKQLTFPELIRIIQASKQPGSYSLDIKGTYDMYSASLSVQGTHNGETKTLKKAAGDFTAILSVKGDGKSGKATFDARLVDSVVYVRLRALVVTGMDDMGDIEKEVEPYLNVWVSFPIEADDYEEFQKNAKKERLNKADQWAKFLSLVTVQRGNNWKTTVTIPQAKKQRFLMMLANVSQGTTRVNPELRRALRETTIDFNLMVDTLLGKTFSAADVSFKIKTILEKKAATLTITGKSQTQRSVPTITAPADSKTWEEIIEKQTESYMPDARNAQRRSDVNTLLNASYQYALDNNGKLPAEFAAGQTFAICKSGQTCDGVSLDSLTGSYLVWVPSDPSMPADSVVSGYNISRDSSNRITFTAPLAEKGAVISVTR